MIPPALRNAMQDPLIALLVLLLANIVVMLVAGYLGSRLGGQSPRTRKLIYMLTGAIGFIVIGGSLIR